MAISKYKIFCAEKYVGNDIGAYLEGGREKCLCGKNFFPPSNYK